MPKASALATISTAGSRVAASKMNICLNRAYSGEDAMLCPASVMHPCTAMATCNLSLIPRLLLAA